MLHFFAAILTLAPFSEAFLLLRAANVGVAVAYVPVLVVMNVICSASAYRFGHLSDRLNRRCLSAFGLFNLVAGGALLLASVLAGFLWTVYGPAVTVLAGTVFSTVALIGLGARRSRSTA